MFNMKTFITLNAQEVFEAKKIDTKSSTSTPLYAGIKVHRSRTFLLDY